MGTANGTTNATDTFAIEQNLTVMREMLKTRPGDLKIHKHVEMLTSQLGNKQAYEALVDVYNEILDKAPGDVKRTIRLALGRILTTRMSRPKEAIQYYESALADDSGDMDALVALQNLYTVTGDNKGLLKVCTTLIKTTDNVRRKAELQMTAAGILDTMGKPDMAEKMLLAAKGAHLDAVGQLKQRYLSSGRVDAYMALCDEHPPIAPADRLAYGKAMLKAGRLDMGLDIVETLLGTGVDVDALAEIEYLADNPIACKRTLPILIQRYDSVGDIARANEYSVMLADLLDKDSAVSLLSRRYLLSQKNPGLAFDALLAILAYTPNEKSALAAAENLAASDSSGERWRELLAEVTYSSDINDTTRGWAANAYARLGDFAKALDIYSLMVPTESSLLAMEEIYRDTNRKTKLVGVIRKRASLQSKPSAKAEVLMQLCAISTNKQAIAVCNEVLSLRPNHHLAVQTLYELYEAEEQWEALVDLMIETSTDALRIARIYEEKLGNAEQAAFYYTSALQQDASADVAVTGVERIHESGAVNLYSVLEMVYRKTDRKDKLLALLRGKLQVSDDANLHAQAAVLCRALNLEDDEFFHALSAAQLDFTRERDADRLQALATTDSRAYRVAKLLDQHANRVTELMTVARMYRDLGETEDAARVCWRALNVEKALHVVDLLLTVEENDKKIREARMLRSALVSGVDDLLAVAASYEKEFSLIKAVACKEKAYALSPTEDIASALRADYKTLGASTKLAALWEETANRAQGRDVVAALKEAAAIYLEGDATSWSRVCERILTIEPGNSDIVDALEEYYLHNGVQHYLRLLRWKADSGLYDYVDEVMKIALFYKGIPDYDKMEVALRQVLHAHADHKQARSELHYLLGKGRDVLPLMVASYTATKEYTPLISVYAHIAETAQTHPKRVEALDTVVTLHEKNGDPVGALNALVELYKLTPEVEDRIFALVGVDAVALEQLALLGISIHGETKDRCMRAARLSTTPDGKEKMYHAVLTHDPTNMEALNYLDTLYVAAGSHAKLITVLQAKAQATGDPLDMRVRIGRSLIALGEYAEACDHYRNLARVAMNNSDVAETYKRLLKMQSRWEELVTVLETEIELLRGR